MKFFVSTGLSPQVQWQLELMIESFKYSNINDDLVICFATDSSDNLMKEMTKNLGNHKATMLMRDYGSERDYDGFNEIFGIITAMKEKKLGNQFFVLEPDMVIYRIPKLPENDRCCQYQVDPSFTIEAAEKETGIFSLLDIDIKTINKNNWPMATAPIGFSYMPVEFFEKMLVIADEYVYRQYIKNDNLCPKTMQAILNLTISKFLGEINAYPIFDLSCNMRATNIGNFIHYKEGFHPMFHKSMFPYTTSKFFSLGNPFKVLSQYAPTPAFQHMSNIAQRYLRQ